MKERAAPTKQDEQPNEDIIPYHQARAPYINYSNVATFLYLYLPLCVYNVWWFFFVYRFISFLRAFHWSVVGGNDVMIFYSFSKVSRFLK